MPKLFIAAVVALFWLLLLPNAAIADEFNCFQSGECPPPALADSKSCILNRDYTIEIDEVNGSDVVVISPHGGKIESHTSQITQDLAERYMWNRYDFSGHGSTDCLSGLGNYARLHITSTNFDEPQALELVSSHPKSVAIHGYKKEREYPEGTICVGGGNKAQKSAFIDRIQDNQYAFPEYELRAIDPTKPGSGKMCNDLKGQKAKNIVNRNSSKKGGLQLELNIVMRKDLTKSGVAYDKLRDVFYGAIFQTMNASE